MKRNKKNHYYNLVKYWEKIKNNDNDDKKKY